MLLLLFIIQLIIIIIIFIFSGIELYGVNEDLFCAGLSLRVVCLMRFAWHGIQLARRPAWGRGYWLSIFMVDLESDYIWSAQLT